MDNKTVFEIRYAKCAEKFFCTHEDIRSQYKEALRRLLNSDNRSSVDVKRIQGKREHYYRIRIGDYRVVYTIINDKIVVVATLLAGSRGDIYKKMDKLK